MRHTIHLVLTVVLLSILVACGQHTSAVHHSSSSTAQSSPTSVTLAHAHFSHCGSVESAQPSSSATVDSSQALGIAHQVMLMQTEFHVTGSVDCELPKLLPFSQVAQYCPNVTKPPASVWIVVADGNFAAPGVVPGSGNSGPATVPVAHMVLFIAGDTPYRILSTQYFSGLLPNGL